MYMEDRILTGEALEEDNGTELSLRTEKLSQYIGQNTVKQNLNIFIQDTKIIYEPIDDGLEYGPPGLGKTTLGAIIPNGEEVNFRPTAGPAIERAGDLAAILSSLEPGD